MKYHKMISMSIVAVLLPLAGGEVDQGSVVGVPHLGVDVLFQLLLPSMSVGLQHNFVGDLEQKSYNLFYSEVKISR